MQYEYVQEFSATIRPRLEVTLIRAERTHSLTGHGGLTTAFNGAAAFVAQAFCECASVLCDAVAEGHLPYGGLSGTLDDLQRKLIADAYMRSDITYWRKYEYGPGWPEFQRECRQRIDRSADWHAVQDRRVGLAEAAVTGKAAGVAEPLPASMPLGVHDVPSSPPAASKPTPEPGSSPSQVADPLPSATRALDQSSLLTIKRVAELFKCHEDTVRAMGRRGEIEIIRLGPRVLRIKASEVHRLRQTNKFLR